MRVGVIGINHKLADLKLREKLAKACQRRFSAGRCLHIDQSFVLLSTCNRTEIYFFSENLPESHAYILNILRQETDQEFDQKLYSFFGYDCFLHLSRVTAGLDSAIVAETEIQGQVKAAYESASANACLPSEIHYLFQKSLKIGKKVRYCLPQKPGLPDLEHAILAAGHQLFNSAGNTKILFVGASNINCKIISFLKSKQYHNIAISNRTGERAAAVASQYSLCPLDWNCLSEKWPDFDWIIFGTKAPEYLIRREQVKAHISKKLIIDLCVPRNVDPFLGKEQGIHLLNIDQINHMLKRRRQQMCGTIDKAEAIVTEATRQQISLFHQRDTKRRRHLENGKILIGNL